MMTMNTSIQFLSTCACSQQSEPHENFLIVLWMKEILSLLYSDRAWNIGSRGSERSRLPFTKESRVRFLVDLMWNLFRQNEIACFIGASPTPVKCPKPFPIPYSFLILAARQLTQEHAKEASTRRCYLAVFLLTRLNRRLTRQFHQRPPGGVGFHKNGFFLNFY